MTKTPKCLEGDRNLFIELVKAGQFAEAMSYTADMNFRSQEEYMSYVPAWWREGTGKNIPEDLLLSHGPEVQEERMCSEPEEEEEVWR